MTTNQPRWILYQTVCYLHGRGVTFGNPILGSAAVQPSKYSLNFTQTYPSGASAVDNNFQVIANRSLDHVFVGQHLEAVLDPLALLKELAGKLKLGGHLVVGLCLKPSRPEHHVFTVESIQAMVKQTGRWRIKDIVSQDDWFTIVFKRIDGAKGLEAQQAAPCKTVCVVRYGAIGDMIILTPLLARLKADGYKVTLNATPYCLPASEHNPNIDNVVVQEREAIPNAELGPYWTYWKPKYDRYINLSESLEGGLLKVEGRNEFYTSKAWRHATCNVNYYDRTMALGGYPDAVGTRGQLYFTGRERTEMQKFFKPLANKFVLIWALNGSSHHKAYPLMESVLRDWLASHSDAVAITVGDYNAKLSEFEHSQVIPRAGEWSIREAMLATSLASCVVGPETAMTNAAGCFDTPKITMLSHSSHENLCKYWTNDYCLEPDLDEAPCYPCHQLHYSKDSCPQKALIDTVSGQEMAVGPSCIMNAIPGQKVLARLDEVYNKHYA